MKADHKTTDYETTAAPIVEDESHELIPISATEALRRWDAGHSVFTVEMGGLGPGYEQAIQVLVFEIVRDNLGKTLPLGHSSTWARETVDRIDESCFGFSGAQVGAAKNLAYRLLQDGWRKTIESVPADRRIQVSNLWPKAAATAAGK